MKEDYNWRWQVVTVDTIISEQPAYFLAVYMWTTTTADITDIYNGLSTSDELMFRLREDADLKTARFEPPAPIYCSRGIFLDLQDSPPGVGILWKPASMVSMLSPL